MENLRNSTLIFLVNTDGNKITKVCLAMKKRGFGAGRWNGVGGKVESGETIEDAAKREAKEEIGVNIEIIKKVGEISFYFPHKTEWNQLVSIFFSDKWIGEPSESEEMRPEWFEIDKIPFDKMWPDDKFWLPIVLGGKLIKGSFTFLDGDIIKDEKVEIVDSLN
ncbi:MAG: pyrophosphohydrolase [Parcubacteria bacterium C7867-006]|nr:MAG: pyrophosphohydrolase [Parcubacteria bacterium C7867-006]